MILVVSIEGSGSVAAKDLVQGQRMRSRRELLTSTQSCRAILELKLGSASEPIYNPYLRAGFPSQVKDRVGPVAGSFAGRIPSPA